MPPARTSSYPSPPPSETPSPRPSLPPNASTSSLAPLLRRSALEFDAQRVKCTIRVRPSIYNSETGGVIECFDDASTLRVHRGLSARSLINWSDFEFDHILPPQATQADVYEIAARPVVEDVLRGYNGCVMAYGQTGAGKTYTVSSLDPDHVGVIPRAIAEIFMTATLDREYIYTVYMSYVQIYMEDVHDLLRPHSEPLALREDVAHGGVYLENVQEVQIRSVEECLQLLQLGERNRVYALTTLNAHSSRSHAVVTFTVEKRAAAAVAAAQAASNNTNITNNKVAAGARTVIVGKLYMVDLAGSERLKKSKSEGIRASEAKSINLSLTALGMCINARADPTTTHVPFRDSKLTRLLQEAIGGNAKTSLIVCIPDVLEHVDETVSSLQFGGRAMQVKSHARVNEVLDTKSASEAAALAAQQLSSAESRLLEETWANREQAVRAERGILEQQLEETRREAQYAQQERDNERNRLEEAIRAAQRLMEENEALEQRAMQADQVEMRLVAAEMERAAWLEERRRLEEGLRSAQASLQALESLRGEKEALVESVDLFRGKAALLERTQALLRVKESELEATRATVASLRAELATERRERQAERDAQTGRFMQRQVVAKRDKAARSVQRAWRRYRFLSVVRTAARTGESLEAVMARMRGLDAKTDDLLLWAGGRLLTRSVVAIERSAEAVCRTFLLPKKDLVSEDILRRKAFVVASASHEAL